MADKTEKEIAELKEKAPWNQFHSVNYRPVKQTLTLNVTLSPLTNYGEEVDLYDMDDYGSFGEAGYDLGNLTLLDRTSPNTYEVNRFGNYLLVASYDRDKVKPNVNYDGLNWSMDSHYTIDYLQLMPVRGDVNIDISFPSLGAHQCTLTNTTGGIVFVTDLHNLTSFGSDGSQDLFPLLYLTSDATKTGALTIGNNYATVYLCTDPGMTPHLKRNGVEVDLSYVTRGGLRYAFYDELKPTTDVTYQWSCTRNPITLNFIRHGGGDNYTWIFWDHTNYEVNFEDGITRETIPFDQLQEDLSLWIHAKPYETFHVYKNGVDITSGFEEWNDNEYWLEIDKESATYTVIFDKPDDLIEFEDPAVKAICVAHMDSNGDGEISRQEAAAVTTLSDYFKGNTDITSFNELQHFTGMKTLTAEAFRDATNLKSVVLPQSMYNIANNVFYGCHSLEHVVLPDSAIIINSNAFYQTAIQSITLPQKGNLVLGYNALGASKLRSVYIPANVTHIYDYFLRDCSDLISIAVDENNSRYDSREGCNAVIETATNTLIFGCKTTVIPKSVTALGQYSIFHNSELTTLELHAGIDSIGKYAISVCPKLTKVIAHMPNPPAITDTNVDNLPSTCVLYVPKGKTSVYQAAGWTTSLFRGGIVEMDEPASPGDVNGDGQITIADVTKLVNIILGKE